MNEDVMIEQITSIDKIQYGKENIFYDSAKVQTIKHNELFCCNCGHLYPNEFQQDLLKKTGKYVPDHKCKLLGIRVFHNGYHPNILKDESCPFLNNETK
jgi:hypothetical protein